MSEARKGNASSFAHAGFAHPQRTIASLGIQTGMHVADFGAGSGAYVFALAEELQGSGRIYVVDIQKDLLRRVLNESHRRGFNNVEILWGDLEASKGSKIANDELDLVIVSNLLFQVDDKRAVINEGARILRPDGRLVVIDWSESFGGLGPTRESIVTKDVVREIAQNAGLSFAKEFAPGAHHYGLIFKKPIGKKVRIKL